MFKIAFTGEVIDEPRDPFAVGTITLGDTRETFLSSLSLWTRPDYEAQWAEGIGLILSGSALRSCLVTSIYPSGMNHLFWWLLYRDADSAIFRNAILFDHHQPPGFNPSMIYSVIPERLNGGEVSEWRLPLSDLQAFMTRWFKRNGK